MQDYAEPCVDCAVVSGGTYRIARGGGFKSPPETLRVAARSWGTPQERDSFFGFLCARPAR
jgi:formylglycine-generating enzyme required for sulfatase activity